MARDVVILLAFADFDDSFRSVSRLVQPDDHRLVEGPEPGESYDAPGSAFATIERLLAECSQLARVPRFDERIDAALAVSGSQRKKLLAFGRSCRGGVRYAKQQGKPAAKDRAESRRQYQPAAVTSVSAHVHFVVRSKGVPKARKIEVLSDELPDAGLRHIGAEVARLGRTARNEHQTRRCYARDIHHTHRSRGNLLPIGSQSQNLAVRFVGDHRSIRRALAERRECGGIDLGRISLLQPRARLDFEAHQLQAGKSANKDAVLPIRQLIARIEHHSGQCDGRCPVVDRLLHAVFSRLAAVDQIAVVLTTVADNGKTVVLARMNDVELIAAARLVLDRPQFAGRRVQRGALLIAKADGVERGIGIGCVRNGLSFGIVPSVLIRKTLPIRLCSDCGLGPPEATSAETTNSVPSRAWTIRRGSILPSRSNLNR